MEKLKTLTLKEEEQQTTTTTISFPNEIIQEILSRLPIKPLLQFTSVSKQWLSLISHDPSFPKLHFTRSLATKRTALFIIAYDSATEEPHLLSAPRDGGPVTHLITLNNVPYRSIVEAQHLNGLVLCTCKVSRSLFSFAFVVNPSTHKVFKLPDSTGFVRCINFFGFHQSRNEHYVLSIRKPFRRTTNFKFGKPVDMTDPNANAIEFMIYSLSTYSWRKIEVDEEKFPLDITGDEVAVPIYDMKTKGLKLVQFTLGQQFLHSETMEFGEVTSYIESILPLEKNEEGLHE